MRRMSSIRYVVGLTLPLVACAHQEQAPPPQDRVVLAVATPPARHADDAPVPETAFQPEAPAARPRLSKTVTLGASEDGYAPTPAPAAQPGGGGPTVIVNNYVYATPPPMVYGGYYYGAYGYGGAHGGRGGDGGWSQGSGDSFGGYGPTGPRTAAPGHTPGVGGNWAPAPSSGPRPLR